MSKTSANVFIIESLTLDDERKQRFEGRVLRQMLWLSSGKKAPYYYIRTQRELKRILREFAKSGCRYLHLSCHANSREMATTFDSINLTDLSQTLAPHLKKRRMFLSACQMASAIFAKTLLLTSGCYSLIGPSEDITFGDAALLWASFYHLMFKHNDQAMKRTDVKKYLRRTAQLFGVPMRYFSADKASGIITMNVRPGAD